MEHSLKSVYAWESKWNRSFFLKTPMTKEQNIDYIKCMTISRTVDIRMYDYISEDVFLKINDYINAPMTATTFGDSGTPTHEVTTSEIIYWQMIQLGIPLEFENRHLNHLLTLIKVCCIKNSPKKKTSTKERIDRYKEINERNKKFFNTKG